MKKVSEVNKGEITGLNHPVRVVVLNMNADNLRLILDYAEKHQGSRSLSDENEFTFDSDQSALAFVMALDQFRVRTRTTY